MPVQLLNIHTTWGQIAINSDAGGFRKTGNDGDRQPELEIDIQHGAGLRQKTTRPQMETNMDDVLDSERPFRVGTTIDSYSEKGKEKCQEATAQYADDGWQMMQPGGENYIPQAARSKTLAQKEPTLGWSPSVRLEISFTKGDLEQSYEPDTIQTELHRGSEPFKFVRGNVDVSLKTKPDVSIEYVGKPNYYPTSSLGNIDMLV